MSDKIKDVNDISSMPIEKLWEARPELAHIPPSALKEQLEARVRLRKIRYMLFRLRNQIEKKEPLEKVEGLLPGFIQFWLTEKPSYAVDPRGNKIPVPPNKNKHLYEMGGYGTFAQIWDVDTDLQIFLRHASVWQEWNATLQRIVPIIDNNSF